MGRIHDTYGDGAHRVVSERPYELTSLFGVGFVIADRIAPATDGDVPAVVAQRLADAARTRGDERTGTTPVRAQKRRIAVVRELDQAEAVRRLHEIAVVSPDNRAGQT